MNFKYFDEKTWLNWMICSQTYFASSHSKHIIRLSNSNIEANKHTPTPPTSQHIHGHLLLVESTLLVLTFSDFISLLILYPLKMCISFTLKSIKLQFGFYVRNGFIVWVSERKLLFEICSFFLLSLKWKVSIRNGMSHKWAQQCLQCTHYFSHFGFFDLYLWCIYFQRIAQGIRIFYSCSMDAVLLVLYWIFVFLIYIQCISGTGLAFSIFCVRRMWLFQIEIDLLSFEELLRSTWHMPQ